MKQTVLVALWLVVVFITMDSSSGAVTKSGGYVQSSFVSTDGGSFSASAKSSVIGPDGTETGECSYTDTQGRAVKISYEKSPQGQVTATSKSDFEISDPAAELQNCENAQKQVQANVQAGVQETSNQLNQFNTMFNTYMDGFRKQQELFAEQQKDFLSQMENFNRKIFSGAFGGPVAAAAYHNPFMHFPLWR